MTDSHGLREALEREIAWLREQKQFANGLVQAGYVADRLSELDPSSSKDLERADSPSGPAKCPTCGSPDPNTRRRVEVNPGHYGNVRHTCPDPYHDEDCPLFDKTTHTKKES